MQVGEFSQRGTEWSVSVPSREEQLGSGGTHALDRAPDDEGELAAYFDSIEPSKLAACWVGCVVDVLVLWKHNGRHFSIAKLAEAMRTVARRLHGVRFEEVIIVPVETTQPQNPKATPLVNGEPEFTFETSPAPAPKSGAGPKNPALVSLIAKLDKAPVGARIEVRKYLPDMPPRTIGMTLAALKRNKAVQGVIGYRDGLGRYILKREAESKK